MGDEERGTCSADLKKRDLWKKHRRCWEGNIAVEMEVGRGNVDWIDLALDREKWQAVVNAMIKPFGSFVRGIC
jgi:hypothetical protein